MECLGFEPGTAGGKTYMNPLSYLISLFHCKKHTCCTQYTIKQQQHLKHDQHGNKIDR